MPRECLEWTMTELKLSATPQKHQQMKDAKLNSLQRTTHSQLEMHET